ncbi:MAG TPA: hypothetical protein VKD46_03850 [bacterium]|nr:hypothetical protein [bacterium]
MAIRSSEVGDDVRLVCAAGAGIELVTEQEIVLTPEGATALARIVRQHLDRHRATPRAGVACHTGEAH